MQRYFIQGAYLSRLSRLARLACFAVAVLFMAGCDASTARTPSPTPTPTPSTRTPTVVSPAAHTPSPGAQPSLTITTFLLGIQGSVRSMTAGPDGNLWFTSFAQNPPEGSFAASTVGRVTMAGAVTTFPLPNASSAPSSITAAPDGNLWFVEGAGNKIGRITTNGAVTEFSLPTTSGQATTGLFGIVPGADGNLWFTWRRTGPDLDEARIGRITPSGAITAFPLSLPYDAVAGIASGPDGSLWFAVGGACTEPCHKPAIGHITTSGAVTIFALSDDLSSPYAITSGPDGNFWFAGAYGNTAFSMIGRITPGGVITVFPLPCNSPQTGDCLGAGTITAGPDGALWFAGGQTMLGRSTTTGTVTQYRVSFADVLALGPDHNLWVAGGDKIGRINL